MKRNYVYFLFTCRSLGVVNDRYLQNLAYCRVKNITVGYTIPAVWTKKVKIERLHIYFSGENLFTFSPLKSDYIDPEQASAENSIQSANGNEIGRASCRESILVVRVGDIFRVLRRLVG